jgi:hypothetical protein
MFLGAVGVGARTKRVQIICLCALLCAPRGPHAQSDTLFSVD